VRELTHFGLFILAVAAIVLVALLSNKLSEQIPIPAPAIFLLAAALTVHFWPSLGRRVSVLTVERVADQAGISPYELLTGLRSRVERIYVEPAK